MFVLFIIEILSFSINFYNRQNQCPILVKTFFSTRRGISSRILITQIIILKLMSQYGRAEYWEERYSRDPGLFDWYQRYFTLRELIGANIPV